MATRILNTIDLPIRTQFDHSPLRVSPIFPVAQCQLWPSRYHARPRSYHPGATQDPIGTGPDPRQPRRRSAHFSSSIGQSTSVETARQTSQSPRLNGAVPNAACKNGT